MRVLACADIHARNKPEGALSTYRRLMRAITQTAIANDCKVVIHAGDLIHEKHATLVDLIIMLFQELHWARSKGVSWVLFPGNHDIPAKHRPMQSILYVFCKVAYIYLSPKKLSGKGWSYYLNPWRLPEEFKRNSKELAKLAKIDNNPFKVQFGHIGLAEGVMSPSNSYRAPSAVRVPDLYPGEYSMTLLGDYHSTQELHQRLYYMGAPIAHMQGDVSNQGVWIIDPETTYIQQQPLSGEWPEFHTLNLHEKHELVILPKDHYKLRVTSEVAAYYNLKYGQLSNVKVEEVTNSLLDVPTARRLQGIAEGDHTSVLRIWLKKKGLSDPAFAELGDHYLDLAGKELWERRA